MFTPPADPTQGMLWPALALFAVGLLVLALIALGWALLAHHRGRTLAHMQNRLQLMPMEVSDALTERVMERLQPFELHHSAHWRVVRFYEGAATPDGEGTLWVADLRGDPFSKLDNAELRITLVMLSLPTLDLPKFIVVPKNFWTRTFATGAAHDIVFGDAFSRHNTLIGSDAMLVRQLFTLPVRSLLRNNKEMTIEGRGDGLLLYQYPQTMSGMAVSQAVQIGLDLTQVLSNPGSPRLALRSA